MRPGRYWQHDIELLLADFDQGARAAEGADGRQTERRASYRVQRMDRSPAKSDHARWAKCCLSASRLWLRSWVVIT